MGWPTTQRERDSLDRHITGNFGEDQFRDEAEGPDICGHPLDADDDGARQSDQSYGDEAPEEYCINAYPCKEHSK